MKAPLCTRSNLLAVMVFAASTGPCAEAQTSLGTPRSTPSSLLAPTSGSGSSAGGAPREAPLAEKKWDDLSDKAVGEQGQIALAINPSKWKHAETEHFILHYRRVTEAQKVAREVEYDLWFVAKSLGAGPEKYRRRSHVYVFADEKEWKAFLEQTHAPPWSASFAYGDQLFLNVRESNGLFNSETLAHEATHAVVARLYPGRRWPLWLNEGFAEYMRGASTAARQGQWIKGHQHDLHLAAMPLSTMEGLTAYPSDVAQVGQLYQTSEKFVRMLMSEFPKDRITQFIDACLDGKKLETAVLEIYGDKVKDWAEFTKKFERFSK